MGLGAVMYIKKQEAYTQGSGSLVIDAELTHRKISMHSESCMHDLQQSIVLQVQETLLPFAFSCSSK